jgi:hypothetical protein
MNTSLVVPGVIYLSENMDGGFHENYLGISFMALPYYRAIIALRLLLLRSGYNPNEAPGRKANDNAVLVWTIMEITTRDDDYVTTTSSSSFLTVLLHE